MRGKLFLAAIAAALIVAAAPAAARAAQTGAPTDRLQVWNVNTARMATNSTDHRNFAGYITDARHSPYLPDVVTLQEAGTNTGPPAPGGVHSPSCHNFERVLERRTGRDYYCVENHHRGGPAIVYRTGRLSRTGTSRSIRLYEVVKSTGACPLNTADWYSLAWRFKDDANPGKTINVGSVHLPTRNSTGSNPKDCAWDNMKRVSPAITGLGGGASMSIMAGDWNHTEATATASGAFDFWECWFAGTNADLGGCAGRNLGWKDAMYRACGWPSASSAREYGCLHANHWSHGSRRDRIDFLFARAYAIYDKVTVPWTAAKGYYSTRNYSDHRGQGAVLRYY